MLLPLLPLLGLAVASAQPTGGRVAAGSAAIAGGTNTVTVTQSSDRAVIDWQTFSSLAGNTVRFIQPGAASATLNRVVSGEASVLDGALEANGRVFLINPNGVLIGAGARIDTAGFVASTLDVANAEFLAGGDLHFSGDSGAAVVNLGAIDAAQGDVFLIARQVENKGAITAVHGTAGLAAGSEVLLTTGGDERLFVQAASSPGTVVNTGTLRAAAAELKAAGGNAYALAINNTGLVRATGGAARGGQIWLVGTGESTVTNAGTLDASSATGEGGRITVTGGRALLDDGARLDASGAAGGGEIRVFGGTQDGGRVTVGGTLDASASTGVGGFVETSAARVQVTDSARVTTAAPEGHSGLWLIDPVDFTIAASDGDMTGAAVGAALAVGNFSIQSSSGISGTAGDVNVNDTISWSANQLTLSAQNNINLNAVMNGSGTASLALEYGQGAVAAGNTSDYFVHAAINLPAGNTFSTKLGSDGVVKSFTVITSLGAAGSTTTTDLQGMAGNLAGNYALGADIDASTTSAWNSGAGFLPIGTSATPFTGILDGLGHMVCDLSITRPSASDIGLFGYTANSTLKNVGLTCDTVSGAVGVGGLVGTNNGTISNSYATGDVTGTESVGGLAGTSTGTITSSYTTGSVTGSGSNLGGLAGQITSSSTISNSYSGATVTTSGVSSNVGGLVGKNSDSTVTNSFATGSVSGTSSVGGLVGSNATTTLPAIVNFSYATGEVTGGTNVGGLVGENVNGSKTLNSHAAGSVAGTGAANTNIGGLVGYNDTTVQNSYATGNVAGGTNVGGFVGYSVSGAVGQAYATGSVTGTTNVGGFAGNSPAVTFKFSAYWNTDATAGGVGAGDASGTTGLTAAQMRTAANFTGLTFTTTAGATNNNWVIVDADGTLNNAGGATGATYPMLTSEYAITINNAHELQLVQLAPTASYTLGRDFSAATTGTGTDVWSSVGFVPLGTGGTPFWGTFDGKGHEISDLTINQPAADDVGLFGIVGQLGTPPGTVTQVGLLNPSVSGHDNVGALVGLNAYGAVSVSYVSGGAVNGNENVGGLVGHNDLAPPLNGIISDSYTSGVAVTGTSSVGGLVGLNGSAGSISNTYSTSQVTGTTDAGELVGTNNGFISASFWDSAISATGIGSDATPGDTPGATGMTTGNLQQQANFTSATPANGNTSPDWNFTDTWVMYEGHTAPLLRVFMTPLRVTAGNAAKTYDGLAFSGGNGVTYFCCPDPSLLFGTIDYSGSSQGAVNVGAYDIMPTGLYSNQQGYIITFSPGTLTVNKADLTLAGTRVYDGTTAFAGSNLTATGVHGETFTVTGSGATGNLSVKDVQTNQLLASVAGLDVGTGNTGAALASNYNALSVTGSSVSVTPADLTVSGTRVYDGTTTFAAADLGSIATGVAGETFVLTGSTVLNTKAVQTNQQLADVSGLILGASGNDGLASNYNALTTADSTVSVTQAPLTVTANNAGKTYGQTTTFVGTEFTSTGLMPGETIGSVTLTSAGAAATASVAGMPYAITPSAAAGGSFAPTNYDITYVDGTLNVAALLITVTADNASKTYGQTTTFAGTEFTVSTSLPNGDAIDSVTLTSAGAVATARVAGSPYAITPSAATGASFVPTNYRLTYLPGALTVNPADLVLTGTRVYDGTTLFAGANLTATGVLGETFTITGAGDATNLSTKNVQANQALASVTGLALGAGNSVAALASNYNALSVTGSSVSVTPADLTVSGTRVYDGTTAFAASDLGLIATGVAGETFALTGSGVLSTKDVQTAQHLTDVSGLILGASGNGGLTSNYHALAPAGSTVSVTPADLVLTGTRVYNGATNFAGSNLTATGVNGETFTVTGGGALGNLSTKNVQTDQLLASVAGLALGTGNSSAAIASNYNALSTVNSSVSVTPAPLTIYGFAAEDKVYDGNTTAVITTPGTLSGIMGEGGDDVGFTYTDATFDTKDVGAAKTVTLNGVTLTGADKINYTYTAVTTEQSDITPATLVYTADLVSRTYGSANPALTGTVTGFVPGETTETATTGTAVFTTTATVSSNVGVYAITGSGLTANNGNYDFEQAPGNDTAFAINPADLVLTGTRVYDGTTFFAGANLTATGVLGETFTVTGAGDATNLSTKNVQTNQALASVTGLVLGTSGNGGLASNYHALSTTGSQVSVTPASLTVSALDAVKIYDGGTTATTTAVVTAGTLFGSDALAGGAFAYADKDAGSGNKTVTVAGVTVNDGNGGNNYALTLADNTTSTINPYAVDLTGTRPYDGTTSVAAGIFTFGPLVDGETLTLGGTGTVALKDVGANQTVNVTGLTLGAGTGLASNYTFTGGTQTASITPANLILTGTRVYDGTTFFAGASLTATGVNGETFTVTGAGDATNLSTKNVQTNQALASVTSLALGASGNGGLAGNYHALAVIGSQVGVTPAPLTVTANDTSKVYGQTLAFAGTEFTSSGLVPGETIGSVTLASAGAVGTAGVDGSPYAITPSAATGGSFAASNYTIGYVDGALTVSPKDITVTALGGTSIYGGSPANPGFTADGLADGEDVDVLTGLNNDFAVIATTGAGDYAVAVAGVLTNDNYHLTARNDGVWTVTPAPLTVTADNASKVYGQTLTFTGAEFAASGLVNGETIGRVTLASAGAPAAAGVDGSPYAITPSAATGGTFDAANYTVNYVAGALTVTPNEPPPVELVPLTITADDKTKLYGAPLPAFTATFDGFVNGDTSASVTGLQFSTTAAIGSNVGTYTITPFGATAPAYYLVGYVPGTLTISPAQLTITADSISRVFGDDTPAFSAAITGLVNDDTATVVSGLAFSTAATESADDFTIIPGGASAANYVITYVDGRLHVIMPTVVVGDGELPVTFVDGGPAQTSDFAVVEQDGRFVLVPVGQSGDAPAPDERLALTLGEATGLPALEGDTSPGTPAFTTANGGFDAGAFELVASYSTGNGRIEVAPATEPGLFRETSVNMGGFNIIYHEAVIDESRQDGDNTAAGSSYREFSDADNPQINLVRSKVERKPGGPAAGATGGSAL